LEAAHAGPAARGGAHGLCGSLCQVVWHSGGGKVAGALTAQAGSTKIRLAGESYEKYRRSSTFGQIFGFFFCRESITFSEELYPCHTHAHTRTHTHTRTHARTQTHTRDDSEIILRKK
jgi:hypothetical protein